MGCEFSKKVNDFQRNLIGELFNQLNNVDKSRFIKVYGPVECISGDYYKIYYHCKRVLKQKCYRDRKIELPVQADADGLCGCDIPLLYSALETKCKRCGLNLRTP
jgi:hypothetical protein